MENVYKKLEELQAYFSPKIIGEVNDVYVKVAKIKGDQIPWHAHKEEDELFFVLEGTLLLEIAGKTSFEMKAGDIYVVKRGESHRVSAVEECRIMLIENKTTAHTGEVVSEITKSIEEQQ